MGTYTAWLVTDAGILKAHQVALLMERYRCKQDRSIQFEPLVPSSYDRHYGYDWWDWYVIDEDPDAFKPHQPPLAFIDLAGNWQSSFLPHEIAEDGEQGRYLSEPVWYQEVQEFLDACRYHEIVVLKCHW